MTGPDCGIATPDYQLPIPDSGAGPVLASGLAACQSTTFCWDDCDYQRETADLTTRISSGHTSVLLPWLSFKADRLHYTAPSSALSLSYLLLLSQRLPCPRVQQPSPSSLCFSLSLCSLIRFSSRMKIVHFVCRKAGAPIKIYIIPSCTFIAVS